MPDQTYRENLLKLVPAEAVAAYTTIGGIAATYPADHADVLYLALIALVVILPFYLRYAVNIRSRSRIAVTTISFLIWATNIDPPFAGQASYDFIYDFIIDPSLYNPLYASVVLILWTFAMPMFSFEEEQPNAS